MNETKKAMREAVESFILAAEQYAVYRAAVEDGNPTAKAWKAKALWVETNAALQRVLNLRTALTA